MSELAAFFLKIHTSTTLHKNPEHSIRNKEQYYGPNVIQPSLYLTQVYTISKKGGPVVPIHPQKQHTKKPPQKDNGKVRTCAPEGIWIATRRVNHSATLSISSPMHFLVLLWLISHDSGVSHLAAVFLAWWRKLSVFYLVWFEGS